MYKGSIKKETTKEATIRECDLKTILVVVTGLIIYGTAYSAGNSTPVINPCPPDDPSCGVQSSGVQSILSILSLTIQDFKKNIIGKWKLTNLFCEDDSRLSGESITTAQDIINNGMVRTFNNMGVTTLERPIDSLFTSDLCPSLTEMKYSLNGKAIITITMSEPDLDIDNCLYTSLSFSVLQATRHVPDELSYRVELAGDKLFLFSSTKTLPVDCGEDVRVIEEYIKINE